MKKGNFHLIVTFKEDERGWEWEYRNTRIKEYGNARNARNAGNENTGSR